MPALPYVLSYTDLADSLKRKRTASRPLLVSIDGAGASGKTSIARGLASVSDEIQVVHLDDFYRPSTERYVGAISERPIGADFDLARLCSEVLVPLRSGLPAAYRIYDWPTDRLSPTTVSVIQPIVIIEGVYSFSRALAGFFDFSIWVECPLELRLARGLARDGEVARARWVEDWMPGEDKYIAKERPRGRAALVCDGSRTDYKESVVVLQTMQRMR